MEILYSNITEGFKERKAPSTKTVNFAETMRATRDTMKLNIAAEFGTIIQSGKAARTKFALNTMKNLHEQVELEAESYNTASKSGDVLKTHLAQMRYDMVKGDVKFMEAQLSAIAESFFAEASMGGLVANQQVLLPLQYLNYLQSTFKFLVPSESATQRTLIKQKQRKVGYITGDNTEYPFPEALNNPVFLKKVLGADTQKQVISINTTTDPSSELVYILNKMGVGIVAGRDKISPTLTFKSVTIDGVKRPLPQSMNTSVDAVKKGDFSIPVKVSDKRYHLSGDVDFKNSTLQYQATPGIEAFEIEVGLYTGTYARAVRTSEYKEQLHISIDDGISGVYSYNKMELADKLTMENTDMVVTAAEIMNEIFEAAKDFYGFNYLDDKWNELTALKAVNAMSSDDQIESYEVNLAPDSAKYTGNPGGLRNQFINDGISKLCLGFRTKLRTKFVANAYTNLEMSRVIDNTGENVMFKQGDIYAGIEVPTIVRGAVIGGYPVKLIDTEREDKASDMIKMIAQTDTPTVETFKFLQWISEFTTDNSYRDPQNPNMPCFTIIDNFKMYSIFSVMARLTVKNKDTLMGGPTAVAPVVTP